MLKAERGRCAVYAECVRTAEGGLHMAQISGWSAVYPTQYELYWRRPRPQCADWDRNVPSVYVETCSVQGLSSVGGVVMSGPVVSPSRPRGRWRATRRHYCHNVCVAPIHPGGGRGVGPSRVCCSRRTTPVCTAGRGHWARVPLPSAGRASGIWSACYFCLQIETWAYIIAGSRQPQP